MTVTIYTTISHEKCRKTVDFFNLHSISYMERKVTNLNPLSIQEIQEIVKACGLHEIFAKKAKSYSSLSQLMESEQTTLHLVYDFIQKNPNVLRFPIIYDNKRTCVGYNEEDLRAFLPRHIKIRTFMEAINKLENESSVNFV